MSESLQASLLRQAAHFTHSGLTAVGRLRLAALRDRLARSREVQADVLRQMLRRNADTLRGRRLHLGELARRPDVIEAYRAAVPLSEHADYVEDIERIRRGEMSVLSRDAVRSLAFSSGTTGTPKLLPITSRHLRTSFEMFGLVLPAIIDEQLGRPARYGRALSLMQFAPTPPSTGELSLSSASGAGMSRMSKVTPLFWSSPAPVFSVRNAKAALHLHALFGLRDRHLAALQTVFAPQLLEMFRLIERDWDDLLRSLHDGVLASDLPLTAHEREVLSMSLTPVPERARELERACGGDLASAAQKLWPELRYAACVITGSFAPYARRLRHYLGDTPVHSACYGATESFIGISLDMARPSVYTLASGSAFFELLPVDGTTSTVLPHEAQPGREYEIVLTTYAGLTRYRLGDVVRVAGFAGEALELEFSHRRGTMLDAVGERLTDAQAQQAVANALETCGADAVDFCYWVDRTTSPARYRVYVELADPTARGSGELASRFAQALEAELCEASFAYREYARATGRIGALDVRFVDAGTFRALLDARADRAHLTDRNQLKVPRVLRAPEDVDVLESGVIALGPRTRSMIPCRETDSVRPPRAS